ncbi:cytochrome c biogenesis heme-transporting ATPase CcmA [Petrachloros mirabilis]
MLEAIDLTCVKGERTLFRELTFTVPKGGFLSLTGENGAGKSTLLRLLSGLSSPDSGRICWDGRDITELKEEYVAKLSYIGHRNALKDDLTPIENLRTTSSTLGQALTFKAAQTALDAVGLNRNFHLFSTKVLSEGQRRRVALARLWFCTRPLWLLDEPFTALDSYATATLRERLNAHIREGGIVVMSTHQEFNIDAVSVRQLRLGG